MTTTKATSRSSTRPKAARPAAAGFTAEERAAMKERARELKAEARLAQDKAAGEADVLAKIGEMAEPDRRLAQRLHELVTAHAATLSPRTWYGMPAYARDGKVVCFFQGAGKFGSRYATLGLSDQARLDDGHLWPTAFALTALGKEEEARVVALLKAAVG